MTVSTKGVAARYLRKAGRAGQRIARVKPRSKKWMHHSKTCVRWFGLYITVMKGDHRENNNRKRRLL